MGIKVPILVYHHIYPDGHLELPRPSGDKATGVISQSEFLRQMEHIKSTGWKTISTTRLVDWIDGIADIPNRSLVIHFDNGWLDSWTIAKPIVEAYGFTATCFVISDGTEAASEGKSAKVYTSTEGAVEKPFITWKHAGHMLDLGWEIGAHSAIHPKFADLHSLEGDAGVLKEVEHSNEVFKRRIGFIPPHFAYPSGSRNDRTDQLLATVYRSLRLWHFDMPPRWNFTGLKTSLLGLECQNIDNTVSFDDFVNIFSKAIEIER
jgi:peptidoglycan/xylan/chitin deacetylase (PgdA/CDA1 family)